MDLRLVHAVIIPCLLVHKDGVLFISLYVCVCVCVQVMVPLVWWPVCWSVRMARRSRQRQLTAPSPAIIVSTKRYVCRTGMVHTSSLSFISTLEERCWPPEPSNCLLIFNKDTEFLQESLNLFSYCRLTILFAFDCMVNLTGWCRKGRAVNSDLDSSVFGVCLLFLSVFLSLIGGLTVPWNPDERPSLCWDHLFWTYRPPLF